MTRTLKCPGASGKCDYKVHLNAEWVFPSTATDKIPEQYMNEIENFVCHLMNEHGPNGIHFLIPTLEGKYE